MRAYEQVFDAASQTPQLEAILGRSLDEAFAIYSGRQVSGLKPDSARKPTAARPPARARQLPKRLTRPPHPPRSALQFEALGRDGANV
jgi:hypothetical protein